MHVKRKKIKAAKIAKLVFTHAVSLAVVPGPVILLHGAGHLWQGSVSQS